MFCDVNCLLDAQDKFHFVECAAFRSDNEEDKDLLLNCHYSYCLRTVLRSLLIAPMSYDLDPPTSRASIFDYNLSNLDLDLDELNQQKLKIFNGLYAGNGSPDSQRDIELGDKTLDCFQKLGIVDESNEDLMREYARRLLRILNLNNVTFSDNFNLMGILLLGSLFNHSCDPNVHFFSKDNQMVFIATQPIAKNQQLFITYG
jgi:SET domain